MYVKCLTHNKWSVHLSYWVLLWLLPLNSEKCLCPETVLSPQNLALPNFLLFSNVRHRTLPSTSVDRLGRSASCPHPTCIPSSLSMRANVPFKRQLPGSALAEAFPNTYPIPHGSPFPPPFLLSVSFYPLITPPLFFELVGSQIFVSLLLLFRHAVMSNSLQPHRL